MSCEYNVETFCRPVGLMFLVLRHLYVLVLYDVPFFGYKA